MTSPRLVLTLSVAAAMAALVAFASFALFGPLQGMVTFVVSFALVPLFLMSAAGKSSLSHAKARWGSLAIGADGLLVESLRGSTYHAFGDLVDVRAKGTDRVVLRFAGGRKVILGCDDSFEVERAIERAWSRYQKARGAHRAELERGRESFASYVNRVRALIRGGGFRQQPVDEKALVDVATDPKATPAQRVGAALALTDAAEPSRVKLRAAVEETANPELRQALDAALDRTGSVARSDRHEARPPVASGHGVGGKPQGFV